MEKKKIDKMVLRYVLLIAGVVLGILYFKNIISILVDLWKVAFPLVLGCILAYILNLVLKNVEKFYFPKSKRKIVLQTRRMVSIIISLLLIIGILFFIIELVVPELIDAFSVLGKGIPVYFERARDWFLTNENQFPAVVDWIEGLQVDWNNMMKNIFDYATIGVSGILNSTVSFVTILTNGIINFCIAFIFAIYLLLSKEKIVCQVKMLAEAFINTKKLDQMKKILKTANETFSSFIVGQFTEAVILGILCTMGMLIFRFPYAPMIGTFVGATALIPVVGAYLGAAVGAFMILMVNPAKAVLFILFIIVLQQLEGNLIYPKVVGFSIGLPGIWVLAAVTIGGGLGGIIGMLLGVPTMATIYKILRVNVKSRLGSIK